MAEWKVAPRGSRAEDNRLWAELQGVRDAYRQALHDLQSQALAAKRELIAEAQGISPDDRSGRDCWRNLMDRWKALPRGRRDDEDALWQDLQSVRDAYQRGVELNIARRKDGQRQYLADLRVKIQRQQQYARDLQERIYRLQAPRYHGNDLVRRADDMRVRGDQRFQLEYKRRGVLQKIQEMERKAADIERKLYR